jgi:acetylornithine/N-succinyldiaminopimelate aminotransferase
MISTVLPTYNRAPLTFVEGRGSWLTEADGRRFLDLGAGIAVNSLGHAHPELAATLSAQASRLWHVSNLYQIPQQQALADMLVANTFADTVFFTNSGTEATELIIKMVRKHWSSQGQAERIEIVTFEGAFHGRSTGAIAASGGEKMVKGFGPLLPGFRQIPWGDLAALRAAVGEHTAAVLLEPILGEGGIKVWPTGDLAEIRAICTASGALLALDEIQCGVGRTGKLFAHELAEVTPDVMAVAKGIGGGFPLGAVLATEAVASCMTAGTHGSTYGGNPLACAVGHKVLEIVTAPGFLGEVERKGMLLQTLLRDLVTAHPAVFEEVRGVGLMLGIKCKATNTEVVKAGYEQHLLVVPAADNVIRILPPLTITDDEIREAVARLSKAAAGLPAAASI